MGLRLFSFQHRLPRVLYGTRRSLCAAKPFSSKSNTLLIGLFASAARRCRAVYQRGDRHVQPHGQHCLHRAHDRARVEVTSVDAEALLVKWLNELLYHTEMNGVVFLRFLRRSIRGRRISGQSPRRAGGSNSTNRSRRRHSTICKSPRQIMWYEAIVVFDV